MGIISQGIEKRASSLTLKKVLFGGGGTRSGVSVSPDSAMRTSAVWACIRVLSTGLAAMPLHVYRDRPDGGHNKAIDSPLYNLLHRTPNPEQTSYIFRQTAQAHICLHGNTYAEIEFDNFGNPIALWPIPPWCCQPLRTPSKELYYQVVVNGQSKNLQPYRILHVMGLGTDGMKGLSPIRQHAETIGISIAAEQFGGSFFGNGMNVGGILEHPGKLTAQGSDNLRKSVNEKYAGLSNANRLILLEEGMKYQKVGIPPNEAQFLETRQFQIEDIARIYGVQLHKIGHLLHATFSNIEHQAIEFVTDTMLPWVVNWEQEYDRRLCFNGLYTKHSLEGLLRGDSASRAAFYKELFYISAITPDQIREKEDMNPEPNGIGDRYYIQGNMVPADKIDEFIKKPASQGSSRGLLTDVVRRIAEREKQNIMRATKKPDTFDVWLSDFYRDFPEYIERQLEPVMGDGAAEYTREYIEDSKRSLEDFNIKFAEATLADWEYNKVSKLKEG